MFIIEVIPLTNLPQNVPQLLSYFFDSHLERGALVEVMIGKRKVSAIVISSTPLEQQKSLLKKSQFQLKKLSRVLSSEPKANDMQIKTAAWISRNYYSPLGLTLKTVLSDSLTRKTGPAVIKVSGKNEDKPEMIVGCAKEILRTIPQYIKSAPGQVLMIVPDKTVQKSLELELRPKFDNEKLIIGTRRTLFMPFKDLQLIIVEDPLNEAYKSEMTPKYNTPDLAEKIGRLHGARIIYISPAIGIENFLKIKNKDYRSINREKRLPEIKIINMTGEIRNNNFDIFGEELKENILETLDAGKKVLLFSPRRGFAGLLICRNCGSAVKCPNCSAPLKVHKSTDLNLKCHRCPHSQQFPSFCSNCNSYKLKTAGPAGTQKIYDRVRDFLSQNNLKTPVLVMDSDIARNETEEEEIMDTISKQEPSVLIATQMIFSYRYALEFPLVGVINTDSLGTIPDFNIEEKLLYQLKKLLDFNPDRVILQTYNPDSEVLKSIVSNNCASFYDNELEMRKLFGYPPFSRLTKLTYRNKDQKKAFISARALVEKLRMAAVQLKLDDKIKISDSSPGFMERERGLYNYHIIIKSPAGETPREILKFVPAGWSIDVDPKSTL